MDIVQKSISDRLDIYYESDVYLDDKRDENTMKNE